MARRSVQWRHDFSFPGDPPTPMARMADADDRRALPPRRPPAAAENRLAPRAGEEDFRWLQASRPGSPESGSAMPSPQLWAQHPHPHYDRLYPASVGSSPSRAQAIAGYRREMLDLVRGLPEAAYELSLRDIVESRGPFPLSPPPPPPTQPHATAAKQGGEYDEPKKHTAAAAMPMDDEQTKKQSGDKKQGKAKKQRTMRRTRSRSMERSVSLDTGLLIKLFMPLSVGRKQKVSPKPTAPAGAAKEGRKKTKNMKQGKKQKKDEEEEWWKKSEFSEAGSSSRTSSTGSSNSSASRNGNGRVNGGSNPQAPARSRSRKRIGCYGFFRPNKGTNGVIEE
ncbi:hypothetical protein ACQ4PT_065076 [Festuca glaucescens]